MLSHQLKLIFVHIPKNAGQSVERCFIQYLDTSWKDKDSFLLTNNTDPRKGPARLAHLTASEYVSCGHVAPSQFENYFKFSFVRNPWAKLVSEYKWRRYYTQWSFKDWINQGFPTQDDGIHWRHVMPQYDYLYDTNGNCLVDFIGHFEQLKDDFDAIKK
ncbi:MAG: sulfotransferase family 2 domain-containing protein, partial [Cyanobacteria bacterium J06621_11]